MKRVGTAEKPGIQLIFIKKEAFADPAYMTRLCEENSVAGRKDTSSNKASNKATESDTDNTDTKTQAELLAQAQARLLVICPLIDL